MAMVDIIIPAFNAHETIQRAIDSIAMQDIYNDICVTIVDDCSDRKYDYLLEKYHYLDMRLIRSDINMGCGQSRQKGIDSTTCKYFMFLDADDSFYCSNAVRILLKKIDSDDLDLVVSDFLEETSSGDYYLHENDSVWMHGKIYRSDFVKANNIRFNYTRYNEDHVFNGLILCSHAKTAYLNLTTYVWKWYAKSLTRTDTYYILGTKDYLSNASYFIKELSQRDVAKTIIIEQAISYLLNIYGYYNIYANNNINQKNLDLLILETKKFYFSLPSFVTNDIGYSVLSSYLYSNVVLEKILAEDMLLKLSFREYWNMISIK